MAEVPAFELWLEFEHWEPKPDDDPTDNFFNMQVKLPDGRRYALNVWTFKFLQKARYPWPYEEGVGDRRVLGHRGLGHRRRHRRGPGRVGARRAPGRSTDPGR